MSKLRDSVYEAEEVGKDLLMALQDLIQLVNEKDDGQFIDDATSRWILEDVTDVALKAKEFYYE